MEIYIYFFIGLFAATIANSTGAGGGVVFIPFFSFLSIDPQVALSTSITIQCFGMTSGSISWLSSMNRKARLKTLIHCSLLSFFGYAGCWLVSLCYGHLSGISSLIFGVLSLIISSMSFMFYFFNRSLNINIFLLTTILVAFSIIGGGLVALVSIGIGELIYIVLVLSGKDIKESISYAVVTSAITVIFIAIAGPVKLVPDIKILICVALGAVVGGYLARPIVQRLSKKLVKISCSTITLSPINSERSSE